MKRKMEHRQRLLKVCTAGIIAALYTVLTVLVGSFGLASGAVQLRVSEALCVLPFFTPAAIPGLTLGCLLSNLLISAVWQDVVFGTLATLLGALGAYALRKLPALVPLPTVLANTVIVPFVLRYGYGVELPIVLMMVYVAVGEIISCYALGELLITVLQKHRAIFDNKAK